MAIYTDVELLKERAFGLMRKNQMTGLEFERLFQNLGTDPTLEQLKAIDFSLDIYSKKLGGEPDKNLLSRINAIALTSGGI